MFACWEPSVTERPGIRLQSRRRWIVVLPRAKARWLFRPANICTGSLEIKSRTTLRFESGATLIGSPNLDDYPIVKGRWEGRWINVHRALIAAHAANHIAIVGPGTISG